MNFKCQIAAVDQLHQLSEARRHSLLIEGCSGSGKTHLAKLYSNLVGVEDFQIIDPSISSIRIAIEAYQTLQTPIVLCIENIDSGVVSASYTLLKFLEEPPDSVYIIVTARNINQVPDTIISRSASISVSPPTSEDIDEFAQSSNYTRYNDLHKRSVWKAVKSFSDAVKVMTLNNSQIDYIEKSLNMLDTSESVSTICWKLGHFDDNTPTPLNIILNFLISQSSGAIRSYALRCAKDLDFSRIADHAVISKFVFDCKYCV